MKEKMVYVESHPHIFNEQAPPQGGFGGRGDKRIINGCLLFACLLLVYSLDLTFVYYPEFGVRRG
eukprot:scaffold3598_cov139-Skeletonema_menzelii.AAC.12